MSTYPEVPLLHTQIFRKWSVHRMGKRWFPFRQGHADESYGLPSFKTWRGAFKYAHMRASHER